jgi:hypothetical protein
MRTRTDRTKNLPSAPRGDAGVAAQYFHERREMSEQEFVFQPEDDRGNPWGQPIRITYTDDSDLAEKIEAANADLFGKVAKAKLKTQIDVYPDAEKYVEGSMDQEQIELEALKFQQSTPAYNGTPASFQALVAFMEKHSLSPTAANWKLAFNTLTEMGVLVPAKVVAPAQKSVRLLTLQDVETMPSEVYKRRLLSDPEFAAHVENLYAV